MFVEHIVQQLEADYRVVEHEHVVLLVIRQRQQFAPAVRDPAADLLRAQLPAVHPDVERVMDVVAGAARAQLGAIWRERMGRHYPAMSMIFVADLLDHPACIELEATAVLPR